MFSNRNRLKTFSYSEAINFALKKKMKEDSSVFLVGQGVTSPWYVGNTCNGLLEEFGSTRVIDTPISENAINGFGVGAAISGMRPIVVHPRMDFTTYGLDPIINQAANWSYMFGGRSSVPIVFWLIINRGGEQGAQHSQALQSLFFHVPGLKVVAPSNPKDANALMISAIEDDNPVVFIDDRWLYPLETEVSSGDYRVPIGKGIVVKGGEDITIVANSYMTVLAKEAITSLEEEGINAEIIDLRSIYPLDENLILDSLKKTKKLLVLDGGWKTGGVADGVVSLACEKAFGYLESPPAKVCLPDCPAPTSSSLEKAYYPLKDDIVLMAKRVIGR